MLTPIYLDYAATTPVDERVAETMLNYLTRFGDFGNAASTQHVYGQRALQAVQKARAQVAALINADPENIIWTSGATEANNLAIKGLAQFHARRGKHIITSKIEHKSVLEACHALENQGFEITYVAPEKNGVIDPKAIFAAQRPDTILVSIMHVNNEIGTIQPIHEIGEWCRAQGIYFHVDAAQSLGKVSIDLKTLPVDLMSFAAHKIYGPKGIGALYVARKPRVRLAPLFHGGGHEQGMRPGTLPTHQIVGMGTACELAMQEEDHIRQLRDKLWEGLQQIAGITLNGDYSARVPHNLNFHVRGVEGSALLLALQDLAISTGSACNSKTTEPSYVLRAIGLSSQEAHNSLRVSLGRYTTKTEIEKTIQHFREKIAWLRQLSPLEV